MTSEYYEGILFGCALGDTIGMAVEGWKKEQIQRYVPGGICEQMNPIIVRNEDGSEKKEDEFGKLKYWTRDLKKGEWTDDTILTMAIAESIVEKKALDLEDIAAKHLTAYEHLRLPDGRIKGGFGRTTQEAFKLLKAGTHPNYSGVIGGPGNGPAMKMHPIGMYMNTTGKYDEGLDFACHISRMTHLDPRSVASGIIQAHAIYALLNGVSRDKFLHSTREICLKYEEPLTDKFVWHKSGSLLQRLEWIVENEDATPTDAYVHLGSSSAVYQSYPFALFMFQHSWRIYEKDAEKSTMVKGLLRTINFGGDCDTTGAIYGALTGACFGMIFPERWISVLQEKERLMNAARELYALKIP